MPLVSISVLAWSTPLVDLKSDGSVMSVGTGLSTVGVATFTIEFAVTAVVSSITCTSINMVIVALPPSAELKWM